MNDETQQTPEQEQQTYSISPDELKASFEKVVTYSTADRALQHHVALLTHGLMVCISLIRELQEAQAQPTKKPGKKAKQ